MPGGLIGNYVDLDMRDFEDQLARAIFFNNLFSAFQGAVGSPGHEVVPLYPGWDQPPIQGPMAPIVMPPTTGDVVNLQHEIGQSSILSGLFGAGPYGNPPANPPTPGSWRHPAPRRGR